MIERADELALVEGMLDAADAGLGATMLLEGPAGIGKTRLLVEAAARARRRRMLVLSARGAELEQSLPFGVVRQLFERAITNAGESERDRLLSGAAARAQSVVDPRVESSIAPMDPSSAWHALYWLTANLAGDRPVVVFVDDLQWADQASASWIAYLARRIEGLHLALLLGARTGEAELDDGVRERLRTSDHVRRVVLAPLSRAAVGDLARAALGDHVEDSFTDVCHTTTGGIPFYVVELLRALRQDRVPGSAASAREIERLTPRAVVDATLGRLGRMASEARLVVEAVAILEPHAALRWIVELTGLDIDVVAAVADELLAAGILGLVDPCEFQHPILRSAVESEIPPARRGRLHAKAARAFATAGLGAEAAASHLMQAPHSGEPWIVSALQQAAAQAGARGAPAGEVAYLERALAELPDVETRRELLLRLGRAETQIRRPQATEHLREALGLAADPEQAAVVALALGQALFDTGAIDDAYEVVSEVVCRTDADDSNATFELRAYLLSIAGPAGRMAETAQRADALESSTPSHLAAAGTVQACLALRDLVAGCHRDRVRERAQRALDAREREDLRPSIVGRDAPGMAFLWIDDLDHAVALFSDAIAEASRTGRIRSFETYSALRGTALRRRGDLADAAADIEPILAAAAEGATPGPATLLALVTQVLLLVDRDQADSAEAVAGFAPIPEAFERMPIVAMLRHAEAAAQLSQRKFGDAAATLARVGDVCEANGIRSPTMLPWRSDMALALAGTDRRHEGIELAHEELRLAEHSDVDRARGVALRVLGLLEGGEAGLRRLEASVRALERSPARLELGWASCELGGALRRARRRRDARAPLDRAFDLALSCGADMLVARAGEELQALGARPRSVMRSGLESLTPSELRVCRLAADGLKNGDIAQALFVTLKTVETHLRSSYRKLDISSRGELPGVLGARGS